MRGIIDSSKIFDIIKRSSTNGIVKIMIVIFPFKEILLFINIDKKSIVNERRNAVVALEI